MALVGKYSKALYYKIIFLYVFLNIDPDVPSRKKPKQREWQHWLVVNIPGTVLCKGETLTGYLGPIPCKGTGML